MEIGLGKNQMCEIQHSYFQKYYTQHQKENQGDIEVKSNEERCHLLGEDSLKWEEGEVKTSNDYKRGFN